MSDLDARLNRSREAIETMHPPGDLWARVVERADASDAPVHDLPSETPSLRRSRWLAAAAVVAVVALAAALLQLDDEQPVSTVPATEAPNTTSTTPGEPVWSGPVREPSDVVHRMAVDEERSADVAGAIVFGRKWEDPRDASHEWADIERVHLMRGQWAIVLAAAPRLVTDLEPGVVIAYGLVLDTNGDGVGDYSIGIDNDTPVRGDFHVWVTDLATGETDTQTGPPYGFPIEFAHPSETEPDEKPARPPTMIFNFLPGSAPQDLNPDTVRFYAWATATRDGAVFASDYAPNTGWITSDPR